MAKENIETKTVEETTEVTETTEAAETTETTNAQTKKLVLNEEKLKELREKGEFTLSEIFGIFGVDYENDSVNFFKYSEISLLIFILKSLQNLGDGEKFYGFMFGALDYKCNYKINFEEIGDLFDLIVTIMKLDDETKKCLYKTLSGNQE